MLKFCFVTALSVCSFLLMITPYLCFISLSFTILLFKTWNTFNILFPSQAFFWALDAHNQLPILELHLTISPESQIEHAPTWTPFLPTHPPHFEYFPLPFFNTIHPVASVRNMRVCWATSCPFVPWTTHYWVQSMLLLSYTMQLFTSQNLHILIQEQATTMSKELPHSSSSLAFILF